MTLRLLAFGLSAYLLGGAIALAQPATIALTVDDAIARAFETSYRLAELRAREQGAQATVRVRRAADQPTVAVTAAYTRTNHVDEFGVPQPNGSIRLLYPDVPNNYFTRTSLQWPIYTAGRTDALERAAEAEALASGSDLAAARADLRLEVVRAYWALATASESVRVLEQGLARADAHLADMRSRFDAGLVPPNEVFSVEAQRSRQQMQLIEAQNFRDSVAEDLRRLTGIATETALTISATLDALPPLQETADAQIESAIKSRAERAALAARLQAAEHRFDAAAAGTKPTLTLAGGVDYANPNPRIFPREETWQSSWDVSINVHWPIWDAGRARAEAGEAAAATSAIRARLSDFDRSVASDVRQRRLDFDSARAALAASADAIKSAGEARRVVGERFRVGVATSSEVLDAQVALLQAELERTRALANLRLAEARLERALGR